MKKKIIVVDDEYPSIDHLKTVHAHDYILNAEYRDSGFELSIFCNNDSYMSLSYYLKLIARARNHKIIEHDRINIKKRSVKTNSEYQIAILVDPEEINPPSTLDSLIKMEFIAKKSGMNVQLVRYKELKDTLKDYDGLFIRETTAVDHYTYEFAKQAEELGIVVIDDPDSIMQCTNKVYLHELFAMNHIPELHSEIACAENLVQLSEKITFPCVIKVPDSCCSLGVFKINDASEFIARTSVLLKDSRFLLVQEFYKTEFDWRIGILNNELLFACKYFMSRNGWQIIDYSNPDEERISKCGRTENIPLKDVPGCVLETALKASALVGNGLYGVDLKEKDGSCVVIEINDCMDIDMPFEITEDDDSALIKIFEVFKKRITEKRKPSSEKTFPGKSILVHEEAYSG